MIDLFQIAMPIALPAEYPLMHSSSYSVSNLRMIRAASKFHWFLRTKIFARTLSAFGHVAFKKNRGGPDRRRNSFVGSLIAT